MKSFVDFSRAGRRPEGPQEVFDPVERKPPDRAGGGSWRAVPDQPGVWAWWDGARYARWAYPANGRWHYVEAAATPAQAAPAPGAGEPAVDGLAVASCLVSLVPPAMWLLSLWLAPGQGTQLLLVGSTCFGAGLVAAVLAQTAWNRVDLDHRVRGTPLASIGALLGWLLIAIGVVLLFQSFAYWIEHLPAAPEQMLIALT